MKKVISILLIVTLIISITGCSKTQDKPTITVASKPWTEQLILGNITLQYLEAKGYNVEDQVGIGETPVIRPALYSEKLDMYWEYTGTALVLLMGAEIETDPVKCYEKVKKWDKETNKLKWLEPAPANNTYTLMLRRKFAEENNLKTISDLANYINDGNNVRLGASIDFIEREDGIKGLQRVYGFEFDKDIITSLTIGLTYGALDKEKVDVAMGFSTDGRIIALDFVNLEDDKKFFPVYNPTPVLREEILEIYPELEEQLNQLSKTINADVLRKLNMEADVNGMETEDVARKFLKDNNLID